MGSVIKKRRKRMAKKKHRKLLRKTRAPAPQQEVAHRARADDAGRAGHRGVPVPGEPAGPDPVHRPGGRAGDRGGRRAAHPGHRSGRLRPGRHPQPGDRQGALPRRRRHGRAHERARHPGGCRRPGVDEGDQRHRHHAAARRLPAGGRDPAPAGDQVHRRGVRVQPSRPGDVHRGHRPGGAASRRLGQGLRRGRGVRPRLRPAPARRVGGRCCGWPTSSARGSPQR